LDAVQGANHSRSGATARICNAAMHQNSQMAAARGIVQRFLYAKAVEQYSAGSLKLRVFDMELLNLAEMSSGVGQGLADIGYVLAPYSPAEFPHINMASELSMLLALQDDPQGRAGLAFAGAMAEFVFLHCTECQREFARQGQVYTGSSSSAPYALLCNKPVRNSAELKGARLRADGAAWARHMGATPVSLPGNEIFEAMNQKVVECSMQSLAELSGLNLREVTSDITLGIPGGLFAGGSPASVNQKVWRKFGNDQRRALLHAGAVLTAEITFRYYSYASRDLAQVQVKGTPNCIRPTRPRCKPHAPPSRPTSRLLAQTYAKQHQVQQGEAIVAKIRELIPKWTALTAEINDSAALTQLYWDAVYSKVNVSRYGMQAR